VQIFPSKIENYFLHSFFSKMTLQPLPVVQSPEHLCMTYMLRMSKALARKTLVAMAAVSAVDSSLFPDKICATHIHAEKL